MSVRVEEWREEVGGLRVHEELRVEGGGSKVLLDKLDRAHIRRQHLVGGGQSRV